MTKPKHLGGFYSTERTAAFPLTAACMGVCDVRLAFVISRLAPGPLFCDVMGQAGCGRGVLTGRLDSTVWTDALRNATLLVPADELKRRPVIWACSWTDMPWFDVTIMTARVRQLANSRQRTREGKCAIVAADLQTSQQD